MAKEFSGVMLDIAAILQSSKGRVTLKGARSKHFKHGWQIDDWTVLVESLLQWEAFLKLPQDGEEACAPVAGKAPFPHVFYQGRCEPTGGDGPQNHQVPQHPSLRPGHI